ncbi:interferon-inducible GTPase 1-like isoform X2 [Mya arenaria]|uniref:interferon-inducible GTPase 1-like isoform X2 n=1 Tax=Mya arenaria TaxID=6604 RepID=UPI0022E63A65|nr:interferon-inducible GTPase 1-like isoform X2 [Mya arenaria]
MDSAKASDTIKKIDSQEKQQHRLSTEDDSEGAFEALQSKNRQAVNIPSGSSIAPIQDSCGAQDVQQSTVDFEYKDGLLFLPSVETSQATEMHVHQDEDADCNEPNLDSLSEEVVKLLDRQNIPEPTTTNNAGPSDEEEFNARQSEQERTRRISLKEAFKRDGYASLHEEIKKQLESWKDVNLNIAVIGVSGTGKSTFINTVIGKHVAESGSIETTLKCTPFPHPGYKNVKFWDIPGVGSPKFPKETYLEKINFKTYDIFLLLFSTRMYTENTWLLDEISKEGKKAYLVRTMIDNVNDSVQRDYQGKKTEEEVHQMIIGNIQENMPTIARNHIFLICCFRQDYADFENLLKTILQELPDMKRTTLALSLSATSDEIITLKVKELKARTPKVSAGVSIGTVIPIVGICVQVGALYKEVMFYRQQLGTDEDSIKKIAKRIDLKEDEIYEKLDLADKAFFRSVFAFSAFAVNAGGYLFLKETAKVAVPIIGTLVSGVSNYKWSVFTLESILSKFEIEARKLNRFLKEWTEKKE